MNSGWMQISAEWMTLSAKQHLNTANRVPQTTNVLACVCLPEPVLTLSDFLRRSVDEHVERPHHAGDGDDVEGDGAHDLPPLARRHLKLLPLRRRAEKKRKGLLRKASRRASNTSHERRFKVHSEEVSGRP